jgi:outer membrane protein TolC
MDIAKVLAQLRDEMANLDAAILSLERLQGVGGPKRRGRPPTSLADARKTAPPPAESTSEDDEQSAED